MTTLFFLLAIFLMMAGALPALAGEEAKREIRAQDGLALGLRADGAVQTISLDGKALPALPEPGGFFLTEILPPNGARRELGPVRGEVRARQGRLELRAALDAEKLDLTARFRAKNGAIEVEGEIADRSGRDRALHLVFRLPAQTAGALWWDDIEQTRRVAAGAECAMDDLLGERNDIPVSRLPFSALTSEAGGLSLAVPMHEPRVFRLSCDTGGYQVAFSLGLAPSVGAEKAAAGFRFLLYRHDPAWGLRSAAQRYYDLLPKLYTKRVRQEGSWGFFFHNDAVPHLEDFGAVFCGVGQITLTPEEAAFVKAQKLYTFKHREPWAWWHRVRIAEEKYQRGYSRLAEPGDPPPPSGEEELAIIRKKQQEPPEVLDGNDQIPGPVREVAAAAEHSFLYDESGQPRRLLWHLWRTKDGMAWHSQIPLNPNPRLPSPNRADMARRYQFQNMATWDDPNVPHVNGVSFDSLTEWTGFPIEDYRRENFRFATIPLTFCPRNGRVVQLKGFEDWEMVRAWSNEIRAKGRFLMANSNPQAALFCGPYLDMMGIELSADVVSEPDMALARTLFAQKPVSYYRELTEAGMRKCLLYGIHPGGLQVLGKAERAEAARPLFKKYAPLIQKIAQAGWQPVTRARVQSADGGGALPPGSLKIERFGDGARGLYFTLRNSGAAPATAVVTLDTAALQIAGGAQLRAEELLEGRAVRQDAEGAAFRATLRIEGGETLVLAVKQPSASRGRGSSARAGEVRFFVDPATNSEDPERRRAYGLSVAPPWKDGGSVFINLPEHLEYMPGTQGIARHHDRRPNVWQVSPDGSEASYEVESLTEPGVFFRAQARAKGERAEFEMTITNRSRTVLKSVRPLLCYQYWGLKGFPAAQTDNFARTFVVIGGKPVALKRLAVKQPTAYARMAQVQGCPDEHNWWAEEMGGFIEKRIDMAFTALAASQGDRKVVLFWTPGKNLLSNTAIPCIHADPWFGDLQPGESRSARGLLIFTRASLASLIRELSVGAERPWE